MKTNNTKTITMHGVYMDIFGLGVLLTGNSGIGKSEIALGLISRGHRLIADDSIDFHTSNEHDKIIGSCPELLENFLEVRGLGVLNIKEMFGENAIKNNIPLQLVSHLIDASDMEIKNSDRLHGMHSKINLLGKEVARVVIPVGAGRNLSVLLETAVRNHRLKRSGYDAAQDFINKQKDFLDQQQS
jgi:HPr kinase/phosphorylase